MQLIRATAFVVSVHYEGSKGTLRASLKWQGALLKNWLNAAAEATSQDNTGKPPPFDFEGVVPRG
jgi:hypothetical protein